VACRRVTTDARDESPALYPPCNFRIDGHIRTSTDRRTADPRRAQAVVCLAASGLSQPSPTQEGQPADGAYGVDPFPGSADGFVKFPYFPFDEAAQEIFIEWSGDHHRRRSDEGRPIIAQHLAKFDKLFPALALILHLVECAATGQRGPVTAEAALRAAAWCEYLEAHARRCYGLLTDDGLRAAQALADKVRQGKLPDGFTARDVRRNQWRYLTTDEAAQAALDWLEDEGWLRPEEVGGTGPGTGRRTWRYFVNPKTSTSSTGFRHARRGSAISMRACWKRTPPRRSPARGNTSRRPP
jgi:hypothetical protein